MIQKNRLFQRPAPSRTTKFFYIFCEGDCREFDYFNFFAEFSTKIQLIVIPPTEHQSSPDKLYEAACLQLDEATIEKYDPDKDDVWFVIDTDEWKDKIDQLRNDCQTRNQWMIAQSNPCFEVWLYYHIEDKKPSFENIDVSQEWKTFLPTILPGGFNSKIHPTYIKQAIDSAKKNYTETDGKIDVACTEVFKLADSFYPFIKAALH